MPQTVYSVSRCDNCIRKIDEHNNIGVSVDTMSVLCDNQMAVSVTVNVVKQAIIVSMFHDFYEWLHL